MTTPSTALSPPQTAAETGPMAPPMMFVPDGTVQVAHLGGYAHYNPAEISGPYPGVVVGSTLLTPGCFTAGVFNEPDIAPTHLTLGQALVAREAARQGDRVTLLRYVRGVLGLWAGWEEAVSTALLGDWAAFPALGPDHAAALQEEIRVVHRQLQPLWTRRAGGLVRNGRRVEKRIALLETPFGDNLTLRDLLAENTCPEDPLLAMVPGDARLGSILDALDAEERETVLALGLHGVETWAEAAEYAGVDDPSIFAERVRRKVRRLIAEQQRRMALQRAAPSGLWLSDEEGGSTWI
ncbi:hypothetical protein ACQ86D_23245 [Streptomyces galilaeus]